MVSLVRFVAAALVTVGVSTAAWAQYFIKNEGTLFGAATCDSTSVNQGFLGPITMNLPSTVSNAISTLFVNGVPQPSVLHSFSGPFPSTVQGGGAGLSRFVIVVPTTTPPYTFSFTGFPYVNGSPSGTGVRYSGSCAVGGAAIFLIESDLAAVAPAQRTIPVPVAPPFMLTCIALVLAIVGFWEIGRRSSIHT